MEKETTGIYISGHPMDGYRAYLKKSHVVPIGALLDEESTYRDDQIVSVAGVIQSLKMKSTRNNSTMSYVTLEDDTGSMEMLAFSNVLSQYGWYLKENEPVVIVGRLSLRDEKDAQIVINRVRPMSDFTGGEVPEEEKTPAPPREKPPVLLGKTLYLRLPTEQGLLFKKVRAMLQMFPGQEKVVLYFADTKVRRGTVCSLDSLLLQELEKVLGKENVVCK